MNVLEKILEEIEEASIKVSTVKEHTYFKAIGTRKVKEIIRSHMDEVRDMHGKRLIDADLLMRKCEEWLKPKAPDEDEIVSLADIAVSMIMEIEEQPTVYVNDGWIPVEERLPEDDRYILLSFENFSLPLVGRYEENEKGGAFYIGDCDEEDTCASNDLFVNAWQPLPEPYRPKEKDDEWK